MTDDCHMIQCENDAKVEQDNTKQPVKISLCGIEIKQN